MTEQVQENAMDEQIKEVSFRFREVFDKSYSQFLNTVLKLPCGEDQKKLAIQFLDTGALWFQHGISHAVESTLKAMHEKASQEPTAPAAPTQEAGQELQQADDAA